MATTYFCLFKENGLPEQFIPSFHASNYGGKDALIQKGFIELPLDEYNYYVGNMSTKENNFARYCRDSSTGKPIVYVPPEPTTEEKQIVEVNTIANKTKAQAEEIKDAMVVAILSGDTALQQELKDEYQALIINSNKEMKEVVTNG